MKAEEVLVDFRREYKYKFLCVGSELLHVQAFDQEVVSSSHCSCCVFAVWFVLH